MKKILFMVTSMNIGGVEKSLLSLLSIIPKEKYDVTVLLLEKKGGFLTAIPSWVKVEEVTWYKEIKPVIMQSPYLTVRNYFKEKKFIKVINFLVAYFIDRKLDARYFYYQQILKQVPRHKDSYDIAIAFQGPTDIIDYFIATKVKAKKKLTCIHFDVSKHRVNEKFYKRIYKQFDNLVTVSKEAKNRLIETFPAVKTKTHVVYNVLSSDLINKMARETVEFDNDYKGLKIITVGRLSEEKGQDIAIKVLSRLRKDGYEVRWYCIGDGKQKQEYKDLINRCGLGKDFILLGEKLNPYPYMKKADIYVQTSRHEGYCLTLAEAKCLKKPIITTSFTGAFEQIEDNKNGFIVEVNETQLYERIKYLIENKLERERICGDTVRTKNSNLGTEERFLEFIS